MRFFKILIPLLVIVGTVFLAKYLLATGPKAKKKPFVKKLSIVEIMTLKKSNYSVTIKASGIVRAGTQTNLVAEVSGRITKISDTFLEGNYFKKNQILLNIDNANYKNSLAIAESDVTSSHASLAQILEEEKSTQRSLRLSQKNLSLGQKEVQRIRSLWKKRLIARSVLDAEEQKLNQLQQKQEDLQGRLNSFKSRKHSVEAKTSATKTRVKQEQLNLSKTMIKAPYSGRVFNKNVDVGQFVAKGGSLGKIYATDFVYVDLPLTLFKYELLGLAENFQNANQANQNKEKHFPEVLFTSPTVLNTAKKKRSQWKGRIVRTSAALDEDSRQIKVIAKIRKPFERGETNSVPIRVGQYLDAKIKGRTFQQVYVLSPATVRQNKEILLLKNNKVHIVPVEVLWNSEKETVIRSDEKIEGEALIITAMNQASEGMEVITVEEQNKKDDLRQNKEKAKKPDKPDEGSNKDNPKEGTVH